MPDRELPQQPPEDLSLPEDRAELLEKRREEILQILSDFSVEIETPTGKITGKFSDAELERLAQGFVKMLAGSYKPDTFKEILPERCKKALKLLNMTFEDWKKTVIARPVFFTHEPEVLLANSQKMAEKFSLGENQVKEVYKKNPRLWGTKAETMDEHITTGAELFSIPKQAYLAAALRDVDLFISNPHIIKRKADLYLRYFEEGNILQVNPTCLSFAPERILGHYAMAKILGKKPDYKTVIPEPPLSYAREKVKKEKFVIIELVCEYLTELWQKKRKVRHSLGTKEELEVYDTMCEFIDKYIPPKRRLDPRKINEITKLVLTHMQKKFEKKEARHNTSPKPAE